MQLIGRAFVAGGAALCMLTHQPAAVADTGAVIFETKCAACHANGGNVLNPQKTLDAKALEKFKYNEQAAVVQLLKNGKGQVQSIRERFHPSHAFLMRILRLSRNMFSTHLPGGGER